MLIANKFVHTFDIMLSVGRVEYSSGAIYEGALKAEKRHGKGTMTYPNNEVASGIWEYGRLQDATNRLIPKED